MGANDTAEQLQAAQAECVRLEQQLARAEAVIEQARVALRGASIPLGMSAALWSGFVRDEAHRILANHPTPVALNEVKAEVLEEAAEKWRQPILKVGTVNDAFRYYLRARAAEYRKVVNPSDYPKVVNTKEAGQ